MRWVVENGENILFWTHNYIFPFPLSNLKERNLVIFQNKIPNPTWFVKAALNFGRDFIDANGAIPGVCNGSKPSLTSPIQWSHPKAGFVKLNFDGSVVHQGAAAVFAMRNENGEPMDAGARFVGQITISVVECLVLRDGMWMARPKV
ncbi:unnamed protein product [Malus baccata var. baccata]